MEVLFLSIFYFLLKSWYSLPALWVQRTEDDRVHSVMSPEEQPAVIETVCVWTCGFSGDHISVSVCVCVDWTCMNTHFLWLSVSVIPWADTLKWTTVDAGGGSMERVCVVAFCTAWCPVRDSSDTDPRYHTLHAVTHTHTHTIKEHVNNKMRIKHLLILFTETDRRNVVHFVADIDWGEVSIFVSVCVDINEYQHTQISNKHTAFCTNLSRTCSLF